MKDIQRYCDEIAAAFKPRKIILFGSHAYGRPHRDSDVDVLVVMPERRQAGYRAVLRIREKVRARFPVDLLVHGSRDIARRIKDRESFFLDVTEKGRVMYEAGHA
ncbi:MAG: nucleotidyltransferase domain-containing protein [Verrucomicrobiaceae bacterium]|nr:nucleotidyltransferase domain-containing protein [Verrucomicrobiaceae bacterium]